MVPLSPRERRTLLAALHAWLNELGFHSTDELQHYYPDLGSEPLTRDEVEALLVRLMRETR
jgi:hypothetical protein